MKNGMIERSQFPATPLSLANAIIFLAAIGPVLVGCASAPMNQAGSLVSYDKLTPSNGVLAHSRLWVSKDDVLAARTIRIEPTVLASTAGGDTLTEAQRKLLTNAVDRSLCLGLGDHFKFSQYNSQRI